LIQLTIISIRETQIGGEMTIALAAAWNPRGELNRFLKLLPVLQDAFTGIAISLPPETEDSLVQQVMGLDSVVAVVTTEWSWGRYLALERALQFPGMHIQYADFDRLLRWIETRHDEWLQILHVIQEHDCLIIGRTPDSYQTHPQALVQTEAISNQVISYLLGQSLDVSAGSKGFSRQAAEFIVANCEPGHALGTDAEWPLTLMKGGYQVNTVIVDGLDWESADRYRSEAADSQSQKEAAETYDADPKNWARRAAVVQEIVRLSIETMDREIHPAAKRENRLPDDMNSSADGESKSQ
jgi:hypothetical protein